MSSTSFTEHPFPAPDRGVLDRSVVAAALYLSMFTPRSWRRIGPAHLAQYVTQVAADPRTRLIEIAALLDTRAHVLPPAERERLAAARRYAGRVHAVLAN